METLKSYAIWAVTPNGAELGRKIQQQLPEAELFVCGSLRAAENRQTGKAVPGFQRLSEGLSAVFPHYRGHVFIMAAGVVVRTLAPLIRHKAVDPAVVVVDDTGRYVVSLLSGHIGGANALAATVAEMIGATPVITTATDVNQLPAIDVIAGELGLEIENLDAVKSVHMALLEGRQVLLHDPYGILGQRLPRRFIAATVDMTSAATLASFGRPPGVFVDDRLVDLPADVLICRPATLAAGIGCNRNTPKNEIRDHLLQVLAAHRLAIRSLVELASIDVKQDEPGLLETAEDLGLSIRFFPAQQLETVEGVQNPSAMVAKHTGVSSVCEAAAILAAGRGRLIVPKQTTPNVTVAIARTVFTS